jgi:hypothetical protein
MLSSWRGFAVRFGKAPRRSMLPNGDGSVVPSKYDQLRRARVSLADKGPLGDDLAIGKARTRSVSWRGFLRGKPPRPLRVGGGFLVSGFGLG